MRALLDRLNGPLHLAVALAAAWLIVGSRWIGMYDRMPEEPDWADRAHVAVGFAALAIGLLYAAAVVQGGRWREYFPYFAGGMGAVGRDLAGLFRGRLPAVEGGGLLPMVEGLLLLAFLLAALTGAAWFFAQATPGAVALREAHIVAARACAAMVLLHFAGVALHLLDFVRD